MEPVVQQRRAWHTGLRLAEGSRFRCGAGPRPDAERGGRREAEAIQESLAVVAMAGDGPESVLKMLRLRLPETSAVTVGSLESFPRDVVAGLVSLISGIHEEYDFGNRCGLSRIRQSKPGGNS